MADVKISQLTAKGSKVASTDRIMISEDAGGGSFTSKYVTGSEVNKLSLDTTPQLGGNLDVNGNKITSASNGNVIIEPNGTGALVIGGNSTAATTVRFMEDSDNGTNFIGLKAPDNLAASSVFVLPDADGTNGQVLSTNGTGTLSWATAGGITVGTTAVTSGTDGRVFFQAGGVLQQDAAFFWDNTNKRLGVGATPSTSVRLDVRAQGALSTDIAFRVRNSANTGNLIESRGNGTHIIGDGTYNIIINNTTGNHLVNGNISIVNTFDLRSNITHTNGVQDISFRTTQGPLTNGYALNPYYERFIFGATSTSGWGTGNPSRFIGIINGTAPNGTVANGFALYSAAVTAGNAAPHFRTENGAIVKVYQETTAVAAATLVGNAGTNITDTDTFDGYTLKQIVKALRNQGLLA